MSKNETHHSPCGCENGGCRLFSMKITLQRLFQTVLVIYACTVLPPPAGGVEIAIPSQTAKIGQRITVPVMIDQVDNLAGLKLVMKYDEGVLRFKKASKTDQTSSLMHIVNDKTPGILIVVMAGARGIQGKNFSILNMDFEIQKGLKNNPSTRIEITEVQMMSDQLKNIKASIRIEPITVLPE